MSRLIVTNVETQNIKFDSDTTAFTIASDGTVSGTGDNASVVKIANETTGASTAALEIDISTSNDYAYQMLNLRGVYSTATADMYMQMRKASDSSYITDSYLSIIGSHVQTSSSTSTSQNGLWNGSYFRMVHNGLTNDAVHQLNDFNIYFYHTADGKKFNVGVDRFGQNSGGIMKEQMSGKGGYVDVVDRLKLYMASGNIVYDEYTLYGFKK